MTYFVLYLSVATEIEDEPSESETTKMPTDTRRQWQDALWRVFANVTILVCHAP